MYSFVQTLRDRLSYRCRFVLVNLVLRTHFTEFIELNTRLEKNDKPLKVISFMFILKRILWHLQILKHTYLCS